jgi:hypothetical protein
MAVQGKPFSPFVVLQTAAAGALFVFVDDRRCSLGLEYPRARGQVQSILQLLWGWNRNSFL